MRCTILVTRLPLGVFPAFLLQVGRQGRLQKCCHTTLAELSRMLPTLAKTRFPDQYKFDRYSKYHIQSWQGLVKKDVNVGPL